MFAGGFAADVVEELAFRALAGPIVDGPVGGFVWSGWWLVGVVFLTIAGGHQPRHEPDRALRPGGRHAGQPFRFLKNGRARAIRFSTLTALCERSRNVFKYDFTFVGSRVRVFADIRTRCGGDDVPRTVYVGAINTTQ